MMVQSLSMFKATFETSSEDSEQPARFSSKGTKAKGTSEDSLNPNYFQQGLRSSSICVTSKSYDEIKEPKRSCSIDGVGNSRRTNVSNQGSLEVPGARSKRKGSIAQLGGQFSSLLSISSKVSKANKIRN